MADVRPFRGVRYPAHADLDSLVSPPYDVLSSAQVAELRARSPFNAVHLDLPVGPGEPVTAAAYASVAQRLADWCRDGILEREAEPAIYLVDQTYRGLDDIVLTRRVFVARLVLADFSERVVLPHERTHAGPKLDRLELYRATHADLSQIFLLHPDAQGRVAAELSEAAAGLTPKDIRVAHDDDGNAHSVAAIGGERAQRIAGLLREETLYIADGHHRYETALAFRNERRALGDHSADTLMVYLCAMNDPGLTIFPTHRLVKGIDTPSFWEVLERLTPTFDVVPSAAIGSEGCERFIRDALRSAADRGSVFALYFPREERCAVAQLRDVSVLDRLMREGFSRVLAGLAVTVLHYVILRDVLGIDPRSSEGKIDYVSDAGEAFRRLAGGDYALGAFINATRIGEVKAIADQSETMPPKSTYFYPKLLTGLVFDLLGD